MGLEEVKIGESEAMDEFENKDKIKIKLKQKQKLLGKLNRPGSICGEKAEVLRPNMRCCSSSFRVASSHFIQTKGVAMGTRMGPSYACLF
eukprot:g30178.t1